ncbi:hypothetical protein ACWEGV_40265, partial [Streptomyces sp. NPDC004976]
VVDLAGQAFAFGQHSGGVLRVGQVGAGGGVMPENGPALPQSYCVLGTAWRPAGDDAPGGAG